MKLYSICLGAHSISIVQCPLAIDFFARDALSQFLFRIFNFVVFHSNADVALSIYYYIIVDIDNNNSQRPDKTQLSAVTKTRISRD